MRKRKKTGKRMMAVFLSVIFLSGAVVSTAFYGSPITVYAMAQHRTENECMKPTLSDSCVLPVPNEQENEPETEETQADDEARILRHKADDLGTIQIVSQSGGSYIELSNISEFCEGDVGEIRFMVQAADLDGHSFVWSCKAESGIRIYPEDVIMDGMSLDKFLEEIVGAYDSADAFAACEVWLETSDYETSIPPEQIPELEKSYVIQTLPAENMTLTSENGMDLQEVIENNSIMDIVYTANKDYWFPPVYMENHLTTNGITIQRSEDGTFITITGTPTADTTIQLEPPERNGPPAVTAEDKRFYVGDIFDRTIQLQGVRAEDYDGKDLTKSIEVVKHTVPIDSETNAITQAGEFEIMYSVTNEQGQTAETAAKVIVEERPVPTGIYGNGPTGLILILAGIVMIFSFFAVEILHQRRQGR